jgi:hypothetical protein
VIRFKLQDLSKIAKNISLFTGRTTDIAFRNLTMFTHDGYIQIYGYDGFAYMWLMIKSSVEMPVMHMDLDEFIRAIDTFQKDEVYMQINQDSVKLSSGDTVSEIKSKKDSDIYVVELPDEFNAQMAKDKFCRMLDLGTMCADRTGSEEGMILFRAFKDTVAVNSVVINMDSFAASDAEVKGDIYTFMPYQTARHVFKVTSGMKHDSINIFDDGKKLMFYTDNFGFTMPHEDGKEARAIHSEFINYARNVLNTGHKIEIENSRLEEALDLSVKFARGTSASTYIDMSDKLKILAKTKNNSTNTIKVCDIDTNAGEFNMNIEYLRSFIKRLKTKKYSVYYKNDGIVIMNGSPKEFIALRR